MTPTQRPGRSRQDYCTPNELLHAIRCNLLGIRVFTVDLAASDGRIAEGCYFGPGSALGEDSLAEAWDFEGWGWLNPPFGNIEPWVRKAASHPMKITMLVPSAVGANWWRRWVHRRCYVLHLNGRITFVGEQHPYPKDCSLLLYMGPHIIGENVWTWNLSITT